MRLGLGLGIGRRRGRGGGPAGPTNSVAPVVSGTTTVGEELSCTTGTWSGEGSISYAYQWRRDGANIVAATASAYTLVEADEEALISCRVTATDDNGSASANSNSVGPVDPAAASEPPWTGYYAAAGITNGTAQAAIESFLGGLTADGIKSKIKVFVLLGAESATAKNMMADAYHGSLVNSPTHTPWVGVRGNGVDSYWDTVSLLGDITGIGLDSTTIGVFTKQDAPSSGNNTTANCLVAESYDSVPSGYETTQIGPEWLNNSGQEEYQVYFAINDDLGAPPTTAAAWGDLTNVRLYAIRTGASTIKVYRNATEIADNSTTSVAFPTCSMTGAAYNADGTPSPGGGDATYDSWGYVIAEGLNGTEQAALDGRVATLRAALEALA